LAGRAIWFYIKTLVWPGNLIFIYPRWHIDASIWWQWLFPAAAIVVSIGLWLLRQRCRGPLAAWLFFVGTLFPVLGFFNVYPFIYSFAADHFQYLASLGPIVLFAAGVAVFFSRTTPSARYVGIAIATVLVAALSALTWRQTQIYADNVTLFEHTLESNPDCWMAHNNLGFELLQQGDITGAVNHFRQSLRLNPNNSAALVNMGLAAERLGNIAEAIRWYESAIKNRPDYFFAHNALGHALMLTGHSEQAIPHYIQAIALRADYAPSHCNLATALAQLSHNEQAAAEYKIALQLQPDYPDAHHNLAFLLATAGQLDQAVEHYRAALHQQPNFPEAHFNWANAIAHDQPQAAIEHYQAAIRLRPDYTESYANLAATCAQIGDRMGAVAAMQKAVELAESQHNDSLTRHLQPLLKSYQTQ
jgi:tetratricopeptide (TPR) repeat protein